uniref:Uncharacterized protein n=4 Tax=Meloidogyne TaxID=189290 RepID=A0A915NKB3_9BILA
MALTTNLGMISTVASLSRMTAYVAQDRSVHVADRASLISQAYDLLVNALELTVDVARGVVRVLQLPMLTTTEVITSVSEASRQATRSCTEAAEAVANASTILATSSSTGTNQTLSEALAHNSASMINTAVAVASSGVSQP